jgi:hypothetical protein
VQITSHVASLTFKILGYPDEKKASAISRAVNENKALLDRVTWDYYVQGVSSRDRSTMIDAYRRTKQIQEKKRGE